MKSIFAISIALFLHPLASFGASDADFLAQTSLNINNAAPETVLNRTLSNIRAVFLRYTPQVDDSTTITSPLQVGGTQNQPTLKLSARKCIFVVCQDVDLNAVVNLRTVSGHCHKNFVVDIDLRRSSQILTDVYDHLQISVCFNLPKPGLGVLDLSGQAHHAANYGQGTVQNELFKLLQLQVVPITKAFQATLHASSLDI